MPHVKGEALAVVDALNKTRLFTLGCPNLTVVVDHKPLLKVLCDRALDDIPNPRLRNVKEKSLRYRFRVLHIPGVRSTVADALSCNPVGDAEITDLSDNVAATQQTTTLVRPTKSLQPSVLVTIRYHVAAHRSAHLRPQHSSSRSRGTMCA